MSIEDLLRDADHRMSKSLETLQHELAKIRTGRAHPSLLEHIMVKYYGSEVPLNQTVSWIPAHFPSRPGIKTPSRISKRPS